LIDIWASWCKDCIAGFPDLKKLQQDNPDLDYVFLSLDKEIDRWKAGIKKYDLKGDHYYIKSGWKGPLCSSIDLDWIPRYILLDASGTIKVYRAITTKDNQLLNQIQ
jgi:thiol-disulfide isomerase/thioredoxin